MLHKECQTINLPKCSDARGELFVVVETSKAVLDVETESSGYLCRGAVENDNHPLSKPVAWLFETKEELETFRVRQADEAAAAAEVAPDVRAPDGARELAGKSGLDLKEISHRGLITTKVVEAALKEREAAELAPPLPVLPVKAGVERVLLAGGGGGAMQVMDIFLQDNRQRAVGMRRKS